MRKEWLLFCCFVLVLGSAFSQKSLETVLNLYNKGDIPYISVEELSLKKEHYTLIDSREWEEYSVSHLQSAIYSGYNDFNLAQLTQHLPDKQDPIVVYCSIGVRSEKIAQKLKKAGYQNVLNLYGGIFEWVNSGHPVVNKKQEETLKVHAYSKVWGLFLKKGVKVYE